MIVLSVGDGECFATEPRWRAAASSATSCHRSVPTRIHRSPTSAPRDRLLKPLQWLIPPMISEKGQGRGGAAIHQQQRAAKGTRDKTRKESVRHGEQSDSSSELSSSPEDDSDGMGDDDMPLYAKCAGSPSVGTKVSIKWDQADSTGWFEGTVIAISDGTFPAPQKGSKRKKRAGVVRKGFSVVEYNDKTQYVHLLDEAHHVGKWGVKAGAWQMPIKPVESGATNGLGIESAAEAPSTDPDDDAPLFPRAHPTVCSSSSAAGAVGTAAREANDPAAGDSASELQPLSSGASVGQEKLPAARAVEQNVWSKSYCFKVFENLHPGQFRRGIAKYSAGSYIVTRQMPKEGRFPKEANIKIQVKTESKVCYIAYTEETGVTLFMLTRIRKPVGADWSNTLRGYQMFTTEEALARVDEERDTTAKGCSTTLGAASLRFELTCQKQTTYHPTDWEVSMDVRCILGVVRQAQASDRGHYDRTTHSRWPAKTSLIYTGLPYSESH